jgi:hypothetical protein
MLTERDLIERDLVANGVPTGLSAYFAQLLVAAGLISVDIGTVDDIEAQTAGRLLDASLAGIAGGLATLDAGARLSISQIAQFFGVVSAALADASYSSSTGLWSGTDNSAAIQAILNKVVYEQYADATRLGVGHFFLADGLHIGFGVSGVAGVDTFTGGKLIGGGPLEFTADAPGTALVHNFSDRPAISIQGGRRNRVRGLSIYGPNYQHIADNKLGSTTYAGVADDVDIATWIGANLGATALDQNVPGCAIAVDPRTGDAPDPAYPDAPFPSAWGAVAQYNKAFSSEVRIEDFDIRGESVGLVIQPNSYAGNDGNGDFVAMVDGTISYTIIGNAPCQTQARLTLCDRVYFNRVHTCFDSITFGLQQGQYACEHVNCHYAGIRIFNLSDMSRGPSHFHGYGESLFYIGEINQTTAVATSLEIDIKLSFGLQDATRGSPTAMIGNPGGQPFPLELKGSWASFRGVAMIEDEIEFVRVVGLQLNPATPTTIFEKSVHNALGGGISFTQLGFQRRIEGINTKFTPWNLDTGSTDNTRSVGNRFRSKRTLCTPLWVERHGSFTYARDAGVLIPERVNALDLSTLTDSSLSGLTWTFTLPSWSDSKFATQGPEPGDLIQIGSSHFAVTARSSLDIMATLLNNYRGTTPREAIIVDSGTAFIANCRCFSPATPLYGIITSGSAVITDAGRLPEGGGTQDATKLEDDLDDGDWLFLDDSLLPYFAQADAQIVVSGIDESAKTITLSGNAVASSTTRVRLGTWIRNPAT